MVTKTKKKTTSTSATKRKPTKKVEPKKVKKDTTKKVKKNKVVEKAVVKKVPVKQTVTRDVTPLQESMMLYKFAPYEPTSKEVYMSDGQLRHFRKILETWRNELMKEVDNTIIEMKGASVLADPNDRATQEEAFNLELRTRDRERKLIRKIEEALQQIDDKDYGYCESCGVEIGLRRLEARPTAVLCIDCKTLDEIRERNVQ